MGPLGFIIGRNPNRPYQPRMGDRRLAVLLLGIIAIISVVADAILLLNNHEPPGGLLAVAGGCIGALATLVTAAQLPRTSPDLPGPGVDTADPDPPAS